MATSKKPIKSISKAKVPIKQELKAKSESFSAKVLGKTIIVTFGKNKATWSKKGITKEEEKKIKDKIALYNKQPNDSRYDAIVKLVQPEKVKKEAEKAKVIAAKKGVKQQIKKVAKQAPKDQPQEVKRNLLSELEQLLTDDQTAVAKLEALIAKFKKPEVKVELEKIEPIAKEGIRRPGERY